MQEFDMAQMVWSQLTLPSVFAKSVRIDYHQVDWSIITRMDVSGVMSVLESMSDHVNKCGGITTRTLRVSGFDAVVLCRLAVSGFNGARISEHTGIRVCTSDDGGSVVWFDPKTPTGKCIELYVWHDAVVGFSDVDGPAHNPVYPC